MKIDLKLLFKQCNEIGNNNISEDIQEGLLNFLFDIAYELENNKEATLHT